MMLDQDVSHLPRASFVSAYHAEKEDADVAICRNQVCWVQAAPEESECGDQADLQVQFDTHYHDRVQSRAAHFQLKGAFKGGCCRGCTPALC